MFQAERFDSESDVSTLYDIVLFAVLKEIEIILSGVSLILYLHLLVAKILGSIFYCILDFLLDFQETV